LAWVYREVLLVLPIFTPSPPIAFLV